MSDNFGQDNFEFAGGVGQPVVNPSDYIGGENYLQDLLENPEKHENSFRPPPGLHFGNRERALVEKILKSLSEKNQEINKTRVSLNQERRRSEDLKFEYDLLTNRCTQLEQDLQQAQEEVVAAQSQAEELAYRLDEKAVDVEDTVENRPSNEKESHKREPSYSGMRELFAKNQDLVVEKPVPSEHHDRKPSYQGIQEMFLDQKGNDSDYDQEKAAQDQEEPQQEPENTLHGKQVSYGGISEMFTQGDANNEKVERPGGAKVRAPSYGGIREMFSEEDDNMDEYDEDLEKDKKHERDLSYGGVEQNLKLTEDVDQEAYKAEDEDSNIIDTLEEEIEASFDVVWSLLVA